MTQRQLLTTGQVARRIHKSARTVTRLATEGKLPFAERLEVARGVYLFDPDEVDAYVARETAKAAG